MSGNARTMDNRHGLQLRPIGTIHSPYKSTEEVRERMKSGDDVSEIEVFGEFEQGLQDVEGFSHIVVIFWFHRSQGYRLLVKPPGEESLRGVFATRSPHRPCPLGLTVVELMGREGNILKVRGLDVVDGTPLLDIKPYIPPAYEQGAVRIGWLEGKQGERSD
jgi:tRNA (adenine37-N6)-methyltransferase